MRKALRAGHVMQAVLDMGQAGLPSSLEDERQLG
jgi:hypothetical protein